MNTFIWKHFSLAFSGRASLFQNIWLGKRHFRCFLNTSSLVATGNSTTLLTVKYLPRTVASAGASGVWPSHLKSVPSISSLFPR